MSLISFVIPLKEWEPQRLQILFSSLNNISVEFEIEIVVVYSGLSPESQIAEVMHSSVKLSLIYAAPQGIYNAYNLGLSFTSSSWIMFLGGDDFVFPSLNQILRDLKNLDSYDAVVCEVVYGTKGILRPHRFIEGLVFRNWCHQGIVYRRSLFDYFKYDERYPIQADHKFNIEISKNYSIKFSKIVISYFNTDGFSQTHTDWAWNRDMPLTVKISFGYCWSLVSKARRILGRVKRGLKF